jgi:hypothetical protein
LSLLTHEALRGGKKRFCPRTATEVGNDGTYNVLHDDGESESYVDAPLIRAKGQKVEAWHGGKKWHYPGKIAEVGNDGTYNVLYDDGESETNVDASQIRVLESCAVAAGGFTKGQKVEVRHGRKKRQCPDAIVEVGNCIHNVLCDDGESKSNVDTCLIWALESAAPAVVSVGHFAEGQEIEARHDGEKRYHHSNINTYFSRTAIKSFQ